MMTRSSLTLIAIGLLAASVANAQPMGDHGGRGGQGGGPPPGGAHGPGGGPPPAREASPDKIDIVGVIQAIDPATDRVTIAYQPVEALNWPAGAKPFVVAKSALLNGVTVGEKVRFRLESQQIYVLQPF